MKLEEAVERISFDINEGEDEIVDKLVASYNEIKDEKEFVYRNRHYLDKIDESRIEQFIERIGRNKALTLKSLHEAFTKIA